jgi:hypothetical protein
MWLIHFFTLSVTLSSVLVVFITGVIVVTTLSLNFHLTLFDPVFGVQNTPSDQPSGQIDCWEVVSTAEFVKTDDTVGSDSILEQDDRGEHLHTKLVDKEGGLFCVESYKSALFVLPADLVDVHVDNFTPFKVFVEKCNYNVLCFSDDGQELRFNNLDIRAVTQSLVLLLFFVL